MAITRNELFNKAWRGREPSLRPIANNEIVIEFDNCIRKEGLQLIEKTEKNLEEANYSFKTYDHNGKSPHVHIVIDGLEKLDSAQRKNYKENFVRKYSANSNLIDLSLCGKHLIANENQIHWKRRLGEKKDYGIKKLVNESKTKKQNIIEKDLLKQQKIIQHDIDILKVLDYYGVNVTKQNKALCPLHSEKEPSFSVYPNTNSWYCFGCNKGGDAYNLVMEKEVCDFVTAKGIVNKILGIEEGDKKIPIQTKDIHYKYFRRGIFIPKLLVDKLIDKYHFKTLNDTEEILVYEDGIYRYNGEALIKEEVEKELGEYCKKNYYTEVIFQIQASTYIKREEVDKDIFLLNLKNGILNIETSEVIQHTPDIIQTIQLPILYNSEAKCPKIEKFLKEILHLEDIPTAKEILGYCLYRRYSFHKGFMFVGDGANGKSTFINLIKNFVGVRNCSGVSLQDLENSRFATANLNNKLVNLYADLPSADLRNTSKFKMLTGEDLIEAEQKFKSSFRFSNFAKLIFSANKLPKTYDDTSAFFRRWLILNFSNIFVGEKANKQLLQELTTKEELSGLLNLAITSLKRLLKNGDFTGAKSIEEIREDYIRKSDSIGAFVMDFIRISSDGYYPKAELYSVYCDYCRAKKYPVVSNATFNKNIHQHIRLVDYYTTIDNNRVRCWRGLKPNDDVQDVQDVQAILYFKESFSRINKNREERALLEHTEHKTNIEVFSNE